MQYVTIGKASSETEFNEIVADINKGLMKGKRLLSFAELTASIYATEKRGFSGERKRWKSTSEAEVFVYEGEPDHGSDAIWAAVRLHGNEHTMTLLKIVADYSGTPEMYEGLLADALHRHERSSRR